MKTRIITGVIGILAIILTIFISRYTLLVGTLLLIAGTTYELSNMRVEIFSNPTERNVFRVLSFFCAISYLASYMSGLNHWAMAGLTFNTIILILGSVLLYPRLSLSHLPTILFDGIYLGFAFTFLMVIRDFKSGSFLILFLFILIWSSDSFAYFVGMSLKKKHALSPKLSPKKSIEGAVGGVLGTVVMGVVFNAIFGLYSFKFILVFAPLIAIVGILGDLFESMIKRYYGYKDSGNILPGHGGLLDRFDSLIAVLPIAGLLMGIF